MTASSFPSSQEKYQRGENHVGILLINLGTPEENTAASIRKYLKEFLSDRRVVDMSPWKWKIILNLFILPFRPKHISEKYARIWDHEHNASPLRVITQRQAEKLEERLKKFGIDVSWAMRYGSPNVLEGCKELTGRGCTEIIAVPMYPQYSATTTASSEDAIAEAMHSQPIVQTIKSFPDHQLYIKALDKSVRESFSQMSEVPERLLLSFHGIPLRYEHQGDPYRSECQKTLAALQSSLKDLIDPDKILLTFQSRFGREEWLKPYTQETVENLARDGVKNITVMTPGFMADCLETIDEIGYEVKEAFLNAGGKTFTFIPCINDSDDAIDLLESLVLQDLHKD